LFLFEYFTIGLNFTNDVIGYILYLGIIVTLAGYGLYNYALTKIDASKASMFIYLIPIFTLLLAFKILNETLSLTEFIACGIILLGVIISQLKLKRSK